MSVSDCPQIVLASASFIRKQILQNAGLDFSIRVGNVDEATIKQHALAKGYTPETIAIMLATEKAQKVDCASNELIIGADQLLEMEGQIFDKPKNMVETKKRLIAMRGKEHRLIGAVVVCQNNKKPWVHVSTTRLFMRDFSDEFLEHYLQTEGTDILKSVGAYMFERQGAQLFEWVEGDFFSILGLPLLPLLAYLRQQGAVQT